MALDHSCQVQRHALSERGADLYETPSVAVEALLRVEKIPHGVWEPCAGRGAIAKPLRDAGHLVRTNDIYDRGFPLDSTGNFLETVEMWPDCDAIVTNPPFRLAEEFIAHAL